MATKNINFIFPESTSRTQSQTQNIQDIGEPITLAVDTGNASYSISGRDLTVNVSNGIATRTATDTKSGVSGYYTDTNQFNFPYTYPYNDGTYVGDLPKNGGYYIYGSTSSTSRTETEPSKPATLVWVYEWNGSKWSFKSSRVEPASISYSDADGYSGNLPYVVNSYYGDTPVAPPVSAGTGQPAGYTTTRSASGIATYEGTVTKPGATVYRQDYYGTATRSVNYYAYNVTVTYTPVLRRPSDYSWATPKTQNAQCVVSASEWNALMERINDFREYKGRNRSSYTQAVKGAFFYATMFNEAVNMIAVMNASVPSTKTKENDISAADLNQLVSSLNAVT